MGNDQLLPAYNVQIGVADEYIAVVDVNRYLSDMDCFVPLMEHFKQTYGFYPKYPVADAGYGSYNNYIFCEQNGIEKYMKFPMFKKETNDRKYHEDPFRAVNFRMDDQGVMRCPNDKAFHFLCRKDVGEISTDVRKNCMNAETVADVHMQRNVRKQIRIELFGSIRN